MHPLQLRLLLLALIFGLVGAPYPVRGDDGDDALQAAQEGVEEDKGFAGGDPTLVPSGDPSEPAEVPKDVPEKTVGAPAPVRNEPISTPAPKHAAIEPSGEGEGSKLFSGLKRLVKALDGARRKGIEFLDSEIEGAIRTEFMRRTEGASDFAWRRNASLNQADSAVCTNDLELLMAYANEILKMQTARKKFSKADIKMLAAKTLIDRHNRTADPGRGLAAVAKSDLSWVGKQEAKRRAALLGHLVAGLDYVPLSVQRPDDLGKQYKKALMASTKEYEKFAALINGKKSGRK